MLPNIDINRVCGLRDVISDPHILVPLDFVGGRSVNALCHSACMNKDTYRPLDPSENLFWPPLVPNAGVCLVKREVKSSNPPRVELFTLLS
jgi:hypothetical protein